MILFLQVTRDKKNKKKKFFLQYTRHKILLTEIDTKVDIIRKSNNKFKVYEWKDKWEWMTVDIRYKIQSRKILF